jgi:hypothetical protein
VAAAQAWLCAAAEATGELHLPPWPHLGRGTELAAAPLLRMTT